MIEHTLFADSLISILLRIDKPDNARIFIKPHPKEPKKNINAIQKAIKKAKCRDIILITEPDFLIEPVIKKQNKTLNWINIIFFGICTFSF